MPLNFSLCPLLLSFGVKALKLQFLCCIALTPSFSQSDRRIYTKSESIFLFVRWAAIFHAPVLGTFRGDFKIKTASISHFISFLFRLCGLYLASVEFHFGDTNPDRIDMPPIMPPKEERPQETNKDHEYGNLLVFKDFIGFVGFRKRQKECYWCRRPDSNRHVFLRLILNQLRLPISPLRH